MTKRTSTTSTEFPNKRTKTSDLTNSFEEYNLLEANCLTVKKKKDFKKAYELAKEAAEKFLAPGYLLLARVYYAQAIYNKSSLSATNFLKEFAINLHLTKKLLPYSNQEILKKCEWEITEKNLTQLAETCGKKFPSFTEDDANYVLNETEQRFQKISKLEISKLDPLDEADTHHQSP